MTYRHPSRHLFAAIGEVAAGLARLVLKLLRIAR